MDLITSQGEAASWCARLASSKFVTLDTEFLRDKTYWSRLCLVQLAGEDGAVALDPIVEPKVLQPLAELLANPQVLKVVHGAQQDLEIFYHLFGVLPEPIVDTQIVAMALGHGEQPGYNNLASSILGVEICKEQRFTDWAARPLSAAQLRYAEADVVPLRAIYEDLARRLKAEGRAQWIDEEMERLLDVRRYEINPAEAWKRLMPRTSDPDKIASLVALAEWREQEARKRDVPRGFVMPDKAVSFLVQKQPSKQAGGIEAVRSGGENGREQSVLRRVKNTDLATALRVMAEAKPCPDIVEQVRMQLQTPIPCENLLGLLKALLRARANELGVAAKLIATTDVLTNFACGREANSLLQGWRYEVFGKDAEALCRGHLGLAWKSDSVVVTPVAKEA